MFQLITKPRFKDRLDGFDAACRCFEVIEGRKQLNDESICMPGVPPASVVHKLRSLQFDLNVLELFDIGMQ